MTNDKTLTFESASARLEEIVRMLEKGNLSLDDSLGLYEEGVSLVRFCNSALENAERKIKVLSKNENDEMTERDFFENA
jgi:exodeoxyribonuclease VII small subunit